MVVSFKELNVVMLYFDSAFIGIEGAHSELVVEYSLRKFVKENGLYKIAILTIRWDYKMDYNKSLILDFVCDVLYIVHYEEMFNALKQIDQILSDSRKRAAEKLLELKGAWHTTTPNEQSIANMNRKIIEDINALK